MRALRDTPFPFETVRDLLGILRMMYVAATRHPGGEGKQRRIAKLGRELSRALQLAERHPPGSLGFTAAWERAEATVAQLGQVVDCTTPLEPTLMAAGERIMKPARKAGLRESKRRGPSRR